MKVTGIELTDASMLENHVRVKALVSYESARIDPEEYWFELPCDLADHWSPSGNPWLVLLLPLAAKLGETIRIDGSVDPLLAEGAHEIMEIWHYWFPYLQVVHIEAEIRAAGQPGSRSRAAQFFSGGVDSFFTALRHSEPDDPSYAGSLVFAWGFDIPLANAQAFYALKPLLQKVADGLGRTLVVVASNLRERQFGALPWDKLGHGVAMGCVGLHFEQAFERLLIPSTDGYRETGPWGSHVLTDHHMSTSLLRFIHDGPSYSRFDKLRLVAESPVALSTLRVCYKSSTVSNCGKCEKCLRTMIGLDILGVLDQSQLFDPPRLDLDRVSHIYCPQIKEGSLRLYYDEMLDWAQREGRKDLADALSRSIRLSTRRQRVCNGCERLRKAPVLWRLANPIRKAALSGLIR
jgi:hypothetical protein